MTTAKSFKTHNDAEINTNGSSLHGHISATRAQIQKVFGKPLEFGDEDGDGKVTTMWRIQFDNGAIATLYDWKRYEAGAPPANEVVSWHIGGHMAAAVHLVHEAFRVAHGLSAAPGIASNRRFG